MLFVAYNKLMSTRDQLMRDCETMRTLVSDRAIPDAEIDSLNEGIQVAVGLVSQCIKRNTTTERSQEKYAKKYNRLVKRYEKATAQLKVVVDRPFEF